MNTLFDLLQDYKLPEKSRKTERGELLKFFSQEVQRPIRLIGIRLSHYSIQDLYGLKSAYTDRLGRDGRDAANKNWWWTTRTEKVENSVTETTDMV